MFYPLTFLNKAKYIFMLKPIMLWQSKEFYPEYAKYAIKKANIPLHLQICQNMPLRLLN